MGQRKIKIKKSVGNSESKVVIYRNRNGKADLKIKFYKETVWLSQKQISVLFDTDRTSVTKHINNIFKSLELKRKSVCANFAHTARDGKIYRTNFYNLDLIISVGYRVNSKKATQFRIWATRTLKEYLVDGYVLNKRRLLEQKIRVERLIETVELIKQKSELPQLEGQEKELIVIISDYIESLSLLKQYDDRKIRVSGLSEKVKYVLEYKKVVGLVMELRQDLIKKNLATELFGVENSKKLDGLIGAINQTFDGKNLYPSIEEKAANLLYMVIKDHPFVDGNKRTAATLFVYYLNRNRYLFKESGERKIDDRALVALTLLIAVSDPREKEMMVKLTMSLIKN